MDNPKPSRRRAIEGIAVTAVMGLAFAVLFAAAQITTANAARPNYWLAWQWADYLLGAVAVMALALGWRRLTWRQVALSLGAAAVVWLSTYSRLNTDTAHVKAMMTGLGLLGGFALLPREQRVRAAALDQSLRASALSLAFGVLVSVPAALINVAYFAATRGPAQWQNPLVAALESLEPGIYEEVVFRFFVINLCVALLERRLSRLWLTAVTLFLAVVPHSLLHVQEALIFDPGGAIFLVASTSLLFGLPMAYLQWRRDLESAVGYHWFTDFLRFAAGF